MIKPPHDVYDYALGGDCNDGLHCLTGEGGAFEGMTKPYTRADIEGILRHSINEAEGGELDTETARSYRAELREWLPQIVAEHRRLFRAQSN